MIASKQTLCIRGFAEQDSEPEIFAFLSKYGVLTNLEFTRPKDNTNKKTAIAHYQEEVQANYARSALHNQKFGNNYLFVDFFDPYSRFFPSGNAATGLPNDAKKDVKFIPRISEKKVFKFKELDKDKKNEKTTLYTKKNLVKMAASSKNNLTAASGKDDFYGNNNVTLNPQIPNTTPKSPFFTQNYYINGNINNQRNVYLKSQINFIHFMPPFMNSAPTINSSSNLNSTPNTNPQVSAIEQIKRSYLENTNGTTLTPNQNLLPNTNAPKPFNDPKNLINREFQQQRDIRFYNESNLVNNMNIKKDQEKMDSNSNSVNMIQKKNINTILREDFSSKLSENLDQRLALKEFQGKENIRDQQSIIVKGDEGSIVPPKAIAKENTTLENDKQAILPVYLQKKTIKTQVKDAFLKILKENPLLKDKFSFDEISKASQEKRVLRRLYHKLLHQFLKVAHKNHLIDSKEDENLPLEILNEKNIHNNHSLYNFHKSHMKKNLGKEEVIPNSGKEEKKMESNFIMNQEDPQQKDSTLQNPCPSAIDKNSTSNNLQEILNVKNENQVKEEEESNMVNLNNEAGKKEDLEEKKIEIETLSNEGLLKNKKLKTLLNYMMSGGDISNLKESLMKRRANKTEV